jgi:hypothetical protein
VCKLTKVLCGLKQFLRAWFELFSRATQRFWPRLKINFPSPPFPFPCLHFSQKTLTSKHSLTFFTFYITSTLSYYFLNKKLTSIQIFFTFPLYQLYITSILIFNHSKKKPRGGEGKEVFKRGLGYKLSQVDHVPFINHSRKSNSSDCVSLMILL